MDSYLNQFREYLTRFVEIDDGEWDNFTSMLRIKKVKKKEIILRKDEFCNELYFLAEGLLRIYFLDEFGEEKTFHFAPENSLATDYESFLKKTPSKFSIQAIEDTILIVISSEMLHYGFENLKNGEKLGRILAQEYFFLLGCKIHMMYTKSPYQRYSELITMYPWVSQRIPQHFIASYLNISSVHLSRLKRRVVF